MSVPGFENCPTVIFIPNALEFLRYALKTGSENVLMYMRPTSFSCFVEGIN
jgi:hypothetical protein